MTSSQILSAIVRASDEPQGERDALVPWWSITKSVLAAAVLVLAEGGAVQLDGRFEDWPFTIRQLLQHTSGLKTYGGPVYQQAVASGGAVWSVEELLARRHARHLLYPPGEGWAYSNIGYLFVRQLIERATGADVGTALQRLVLGPAGVTRTLVVTTVEDMAQTRWGNVAGYDPRWVYHGLLIGPPVDAVQFLAGLLDGKIISAASLQMMHSVRVLDGVPPGRPWTRTGYGLGLMFGTMGDAGRAVGHSGAGPGGVSALYAFPDLPRRPIVAAFAQASDEGVTEYEAVRLALTV